MIFREKHSDTTARISLRDLIEIDLGIVPDSDRQWVIVPSAGKKTARRDAPRLVESYRYSSAAEADAEGDRSKAQHRTTGSLDRQYFRLQPVKTGSFALELHYKSLWESAYAKHFTLHLQVTS